MEPIANPDGNGLSPEQGGKIVGFFEPFGENAVIKSPLVPGLGDVRLVSRDTFTGVKLASSVARDAEILVTPRGAVLFTKPGNSNMVGHDTVSPEIRGQVTAALANFADKHIE